MRFLFSPVPVTGHLSPALPLMRRLVERGHDVCCVTGARFRRAVEATGAAHESFRSAPDIEFERLTTLFPDRPKRAGIAQARWDLKRLMIDLGADQYPDLLAVANEQQPDAIVADAMSLAGQLAAETLALPLAVLCPLNLFVPSCDTPPDGFGLAPTTSALGRIRNRCLNWFVHDVMLGDVGRYLSDVRMRLGLPLATSRFFEQAVTNSQLFLQPTVSSFEYPRGDLPDHVHFIGALIPSPADTFDPPAWWDELEDARPVVLVTQGTVATDFDDLLIPTMRGLADEDLLVVATTAKRRLALDGNTHPVNLRLEPFVPFARLMPFVDVMVTNGGYGGVHFALTHGVPLVVAGESEDKAEICARVAWSGVGVNLKMTRPTPAAVRDGVRRVLDESRYRARAAAFRDEFAAIDGPTRGAELLERLVRTGERVTRGPDQPLPDHPRSH